MREYRALSVDQIRGLESQGNISNDWGRVLVTERFTAANIYNCRFEGDCFIGLVEGRVLSPSGVERKSTLSNTSFLNCTIGDGVFVSNTGSYIASYSIGDGAYVEGCGVIETTGESCFGNGVRVAVINESGGRQVPIYDYLSAQTAYIIALYRHRNDVVSKIEGFIDRYCQQIRSSRGRIGAYSSVCNTNTLCGVNVGDHAKVIGAQELCNGTVNSSKESPSFVGSGVVAKDFIFADGSDVDSGSIVIRSFVGQGAHIECGYSSTDSLFFANSHMANGEACSIFAAPYSVSHHRSSLLIAGYFAFFNAGSGTNQSNHLFKTGAVHQGFHARGCKFASNGYVMLPAREGAFTMIMGRHINHHDTENFPYSYLIEDKGSSMLIPGANLASYGTVRDINKWGQRDKRKGDKRDRIHFDRYNPYVGERIEKAISISKELLSKDLDVLSYNRTHIKSSLMRRGITLYEAELKATIGHLLGLDSLPEGKSGVGQWVDMAGMYAPKSEVESLLNDIEQGVVESVQGIEERLDEIFFNYKAFAVSWAKERMGNESMQTIIEQGNQAAETLSLLAQSDAAKDFNATAKVGYGIDFEQDADIDFDNVRR